MGFSSIQLLTKQDQSHIMKFALAVMSAGALASAEAYYGGGYYGGLGAYGYGKRSADADAYYGGGYYGGHGYGYGKRSADAEAYYGGYARGYGYGYGKRSADAEAYYGYGGYGGYGLPYYGVYGYGVAPYAVVPEIEPKATGFIVSPASGAVTPDFTAEQKEANPEIAEGSKSIDVPVVTGFTHVLGKREAEPYYYGGYGYGGYLYGKRSAEAEAKPYYGLGYGVYGSGGYLYGKRSAEAEAKPYYGYGGYGLGLGYGYAAAPVVEPKDSGLIITPSSGAVTPAFTDAQKEANPEIAEGSESIKVPVVTGVHLIGKREAEPYYGLGYGYGGY